MLAFTYAGYLAAGWGISLAVLGGYAWITVRRGRARAALVPAKERRWS